MRSYPVPAKVLADIEGEGPLANQVRANGSIDRADLERAAWIDHGALGEWANKVIAGENSVVLSNLLGDEERLPVGLVDSDDEDVVYALKLDDRIFKGGEWGTISYLADDVEQIELDEATVASIAEALTAGADGVLLRPWFPVAIIAAPDPAAAPVDLPSDAKVVAVVDDLDRTAVLELLAVAPGPKVYRRNDGTWNEDDGWLNQLRGVKPPPLVELEPTVASGVAAQVDESTKGEPFVAYGKRPVAASAWAEEFQAKADESALRFALLGASKVGDKVKGHAMGAEKLREYWTTGVGGTVKIRWRTPGSWRRCHRHLLKYLGPRAAGYCTRLGERMGGRGVAWDVSGRAKRAAKKALK